MGRLDPTAGAARLAFGTVAEVAPDLARVRVALPEEGDDFVTLPLPVLALGTVADKGWWLPDVGEQVAVVYDGDGGVVLGPVYSEAARPAEDDPAVRALAFSDGGAVRYDRARSRLSVAVPGPAEVTAGGGLYLGGEDGAQPVPKGDDLLRRIERLEAVVKAHVHPGSGVPPVPATTAPLDAPLPFLSGHTRTT